MKRHAQFRVERVTEAYVILRDLGPWTEYPTITNDADGVVRWMVKFEGLGARRLYYIDSTGQTDELLIKDGAFAGFAPGGPAV